MLSQEQRIDLEKQLDSLQRQYAPKFGENSIAQKFHELGKRESGGPPKLSLAERQLALLEAGKTLRSNSVGVGPTGKHDEFMLRKEGMDLSLQQLRADAFRMQASLTEITLAVNKPRRDAAKNVVASWPDATPSDKIKFAEQQKILMEQRRQLDALRQDRQVLQDEQERVLRETRADFYDTLKETEAKQKRGEFGTSTTSLLDPRTVRGFLPKVRAEAAAAVRVSVPSDGDRLPLLVRGTPVAAQDGYLLVELYSVEGVSATAIEKFAVDVVDNSTNRFVTGAFVLGPLLLDGLSPKRVQLTVPPQYIKSNLQVGLVLSYTSYGGVAMSAKTFVSFGTLRAERLDPIWLDLEATAGKVRASVAMSGVQPLDEKGKGVAAGRVVQPENATRTLWVPDLPPSQEYMRQQKVAFENDEKQFFAHGGSGVAEEQLGPSSMFDFIKPPFYAFAGFAGGSPRDIASDAESFETPEIILEQVSGIEQLEYDDSSETPPFAAFAGVALNPKKVESEGVNNAVTTMKNSINKALQLIPPRFEEGVTIADLFARLRQITSKSRLKASDAQDVLEFAAVVASRPKELDDLNEEVVGEYIGMLMNALEAFPASVTLSVWCLEAFLAVIDVANDSYRSQLMTPLFESFATVILRFGRDAELDFAIHSRLISGLASVTNPDSPTTHHIGLIDYILLILQRFHNYPPTPTVENVLALLCGLGCTHKVAEQITFALSYLRGFKSDARIVTRSLVALGELVFTVIDTTQNNVRPDELPALVEHLPEDGSDVHLVVSSLDLYPNHRKVAGAAVRALAALAQTSELHLQNVIRSGQRVIMLAQTRHINSRSVHLHAVEIVRCASRHDIMLITDGLVVMVSNALHAVPSDEEVVLASLHSLAALVDHGLKLYKVAECLSESQMLLIWKTHHADTKIITSLSHIVGGLIGSSNRVADLYGRANVANLLLKALDEHTHDSEIAITVSRTIKRLASHNAESLVQIAAAQGGRTLFNAMVDNNKSVAAAQACLAAIASVGQHEEVKLQLLDLGNSAGHTGVELNVVKRIVEMLALEDPDVLAQACCVLGVLTYTKVEELKGKSMRMRSLFDRETLAFYCQELASKYRHFKEQPEYFERLINVAPLSDLSAPRLLGLDGKEVGRIERKRPNQAASGSKDERLVQEPSFDVFGPLRGLGIGEAPLEDNSEVDFDALGISDESDA